MTTNKEETPIVGKIKDLEIFKIDGKSPKEFFRDFVKKQKKSQKEEKIAINRTENFLSQYYLGVLIKKMCSFIGVDFEKIDFNNNRWYQTHKWTIAKERRFEKEIVDYLHKRKRAREKLMRFPSANKRTLKEFAKEFTFQWGWSYYEDVW